MLFPDGAFIVLGLLVVLAIAAVTALSPKLIWVRGTLPIRRYRPRRTGHRSESVVATRFSLSRSIFTDDFDVCRIGEKLP